MRILAHAAEYMCVCELVDILRRPQYAVSRSLAVLRRTGMVEEDRRGRLMYYRIKSDPFNDRITACLREIPADDRVGPYDLDRLRWRRELRRNGRCIVTYTAGYNPDEYAAEGIRGDGGEKPRVLFVCEHNGAGSRMAEEYLRKFGGDHFEVESAGLEAGGIEPDVADLMDEVMKEEGIDLSGKSPQAVWDRYRSGKTYRWVIALCSPEAEEGCPNFPGPVDRLSWPMRDPSAFEGSRDEILAQTREVRDEIRERVRRFVDSYLEDSRKE